MYNVIKFNFDQQNLTYISKNVVHGYNEILSINISERLKKTKQLMRNLLVCPTLKASPRLATSV